MARQTFKVGDVVKNLYFVLGPLSPLGYPMSLCRETRCKVEEVSTFKPRGQPKGERLKLVREDGQPGFWWVDASDVEVA
jgi:hypothetical protein